MYAGGPSYPVLYLVWFLNADIINKNMAIFPTIIDLITNSLRVVTINGTIAD